MKAQPEWDCLCDGIDGLLVACKGALAALSQNATYPADIEAAKKWLRDAITKAEGGEPMC